MHVEVHANTVRNTGTNTVIIGNVRARNGHVRNEMEPNRIKK